MGYMHYFNIKNVSATEIKRNLRENGLPTTNLAMYLSDKNFRHFIYKKGKPKSPKTFYSLTHPGNAKAKEVIIEMIKSKLYKSNVNFVKKGNFVKNEKFLNIA
jgi:hypothetical protein